MPPMTTPTALLSIAIAGMALTHVSHVSADRQRHEVSADVELLFLPSGATTKIISMGYHEVVADLFWIRSVLVFGERWEKDDPAEWGPWLAGLLKAIVELDPGWRTPYFYGGTMLRVIEDIDSSNEIFLAATQALPDDPFFPFALGMNAYLYQDDPMAAARWISRAAELPGAPSWYKAAAAGFLAEKNQRATAIRFLREERDSTSDPQVHEMLDEKLNELMHDELAEKLESLRRQFMEKTGRDITSIQQLEDLTTTFPQDPLGGEWILASDGRIRSSIREAREAARARARELSLLRRR